MSDKLLTTSDLDRLAQTGAGSLYPKRLQILIGASTCGLAMGAARVEEAVLATVKKFKFRSRWWTSSGPTARASVSAT